jgi:hypothetical protein
MTFDLFGIFRPVPPPTYWTEPVSADVLDLRSGERMPGLMRTDFPWLEGVKPLPKRTGRRTHLRLVVNHDPAAGARDGASLDRRENDRRS